ncbi:MAG: UDP-N-acetylmuramoyl-tripeptide--D-alanyl-D-alanine ligase [Planctomycetota bacterium]
MEPVSLQFVVESTGARPARAPAGNTLFRSVSTDSRTCPADSLFVAIRGEKFNGNEFAPAALQNGAGGVLVAPGAAQSDRNYNDHIFNERTVLEHPSPEQALLQLAKRYRDQYSIPIVGVAGAAGKTTTKEITAHLLKSLGPIVASEKSFNNSIGVPHTLFKIEKSTRAAVVEIGTNSKGEVAALAAVVSPTLGIITVIAEEHLEGLGDLDGVCREEGALLDVLPAGGIAFLNADDHYYPILRKRARSKVVTFGIENAADFSAKDILFHIAGCSFKVQGRAATVPLLGTHNVYNALAAIAIATTLGVPLDESLHLLADMKPPHRRLERKRFGDVEIIDDCYNANPGSVRAAIRALEGLRNGRRRIFVLGKMHELGAKSSELHTEIGREIGRARFDMFIAIGAESRELVKGAVDAGMSAGAIIQFPSAADAQYHIPEIVKDGDLVLVKGSRAEGLERIIDALRARFEPREEGHL